jgi:23S rRNA (cytidine2498-2'-O)-methyltransferase
MKKRYEEVSHILEKMQTALKDNGVNAQIAAKQLYHDREEITVHVRRIWAATSPKANAYRRYRDDE